MALTPLYVKFRTKAGTCYFYDPCTNEIVRVGEAIYQILDDYHVLDPDEIIEKHHALGERTVRTALAQLQEIQSRGILCDHHPQLTSRARWIRCEGKLESLEDFLRHRRRLLTLELTQQCNLRCEYCCFGEHYPQTRQPARTPMSLETAKDAVRAFMDHKPKRAGIGFYGGEPLLEFELLSNIVVFAEKLAVECGTNLSFSVTTNGTLLTAEKIHFLSDHAFSILISLDGDKDSHDRYRVFRNDKAPEQRVGSFDTVIENMERFVELYPDYLRRGIVVTLTATSDLEEVERFVSGWQRFFPTIIGSLVQKVPLETRYGCSDRSIEIGDFGTPPCGEGFCGKVRRLETEAQPETHETDVGRNNADEPEDHNKRGQLPEFGNWIPECVDRLQSRQDRFMAEARLVRNASDANLLKSNYPISSFLFDRRFRNIHFRRFPANPDSGRQAFRMSCYPGATRTFCSVQGVLFSCEKTERGRLFELGGGSDHLDVGKACELTEMVRLLCDCGNCTANRFCSHCSALVSESRKNPGLADAMAFQGECRRTAQAGVPSRLSEYAGMMEANPEMVDMLLSATSMDDDWLNDVRIMAPKRKEADVGVEEIAELV